MDVELVAGGVVNCNGGDNGDELEYFREWRGLSCVYESAVESKTE